MMHRRLACLAILLLAVALPARAQAPAELAPHDTQVYLHIAGFHGWFELATRGPAGETLRAEMDESPQWQMLLALLEMDRDTFLATYFGGDVVVIGPELHEGVGGIILTEVAPDDALFARERLFLEVVEDIGDATLYRTADGGGLVAITEGWVGLCGAESLGYMRDVLRGWGGDRSLATSDHYNEWTGRLPEDRTVTAYLTGGAAETHALGVVRVGDGVDATYYGRSANFGELLAVLGEALPTGLDMLPRETLGAAVVNIVAHEVGDDAQRAELMAALDMLAAPASFERDILPMLGGPAVVFMGEPADADALDLPLPVMGLAFALDDDAVVPDLLGMMDKTMLLANLATAEWGVDPIRFERNRHGESTYRVAHIGRPLAQQSGWPEMEQLQIVYGQVGEAFVVCTEEAFFQHCVDTAAAGGGAFEMGLAGDAPAGGQTPILAVTARPQRMAGLVEGWLGFVERQGPGLGIDVPVVGAELSDLAAVLGQYASMDMQFWRGDDGLVVGRMRLEAE